MRIEEPKVLARLTELSVELRREVSLAELTYLGIGGTTDLLLIRRHEAIPDLLKLLDERGVPHKFLGGGSNLLVVDGELPFVVLQLVKGEPEISLEGNIASVDAAADLGQERHAYLRAGVRDARHAPPGRHGAEDGRNLHTGDHPLGLFIGQVQADRRLLLLSFTGEMEMDLQNEIGALI